MVILISSAVRSPISRLYLRLICWRIASSILSPATRTEREKTTARERNHRHLGGTAADVHDQVGRWFGDRQPPLRSRLPSAPRSSIPRATPADSAASHTARFSTAVMPDGT